MISPNIGVLAIFLSCAYEAGNLIANTADRIVRYYPVECHDVKTSDGYILTIFRIPHTPELQTTNKSRPIVFIQHGFLGSSDFWTLNGPENSLPYLFADLGFDVWLGNNRGNPYGKRNVYVSSDSTSFWNFSLDELALKDLPAMIDYILHYTKEDALHYVGYSQGTTIFFVLMSEISVYNAKIKTAHMLAPVAYTSDVTVWLRIFAPILGHPTFISNLLEGHDLIQSSKLLSWLTGTACSCSFIQPICYTLFALFAMEDYKNLNFTLLPDFFQTHPSGSSTGQLIHYYQLHESGFFRKYDHGKIENVKTYGQPFPPIYNLKNVTAPVRLYYGSNDVFVPIESINKLKKLLPNIVDSYNIPITGWSHVDFGLGLKVKEIIYDRIIKAVVHFEKTGIQLQFN